jgi:hypothetical protein
VRGKKVEGSKEERKRGRELFLFLLSFIFLSLGKYRTANNFDTLFSCMFYLNMYSHLQHSLVHEAPVAPAPEPLHRTGQLAGVVLLVMTYVENVGYAFKTQFDDW